MNAEEIVYLYVKAYEEGFHRSESNQYAVRKKFARAYAAEVCPEGTQAVREYLATTNRGKSASSPTDRIGRAVVEGIKALRLKADFDKGKRRRKKPETLPAVIEVKRPDTLALYHKAADTFEIIPNDGVLSHFTGHPAGLFIEARASLKEQGYLFEVVLGGWSVTRPQPATGGIDTDLVAEVVAKVLLSMKRGS